MDDLQKTLSLTETLSRLAEKDVLSEKEASALLEAAELLKKYAQSLRRQAEEAAVEKGNTKWTEEEEKRLAKEYKGGMPVGEIAAAHRRSPSGVISRLSNSAFCRRTTLTVKSVGRRRKKRSFTRIRRRAHARRNGRPP